MKFDFWFNNTLVDVVRIDCYFYPDKCIYRGNLYDINNKIIGDFVVNDSLIIEKYFPGIFGN